MSKLMAVESLSHCAGIWYWSTFWGEPFSRREGQGLKMTPWPQILKCSTRRASGRKRPIQVKPEEPLGSLQNVLLPAWELQGRDVEWAGGGVKWAHWQWGEPLSMLTPGRNMKQLVIIYKVCIHLRMSSLKWWIHGLCIGLCSVGILKLTMLVLNEQHRSAIVVKIISISWRKQRETNIS